MDKIKEKIYLNNGYIGNQKDIHDMPYGSRGTVAGNGCGSVACYNLLHHFKRDISYEEVYSYFNSTRNVLFKGKWGTNPFSVKKYLKHFGFNIKTYLGRIPKEAFNAYIILNIYKTRKKTSGHYVFTHFKDNMLATYNLNRTYESIEDYLKKNGTVRRLFIVWGVNKGLN